MNIKFKRVLLKLSGESLMGNAPANTNHTQGIFDISAINNIIHQIQQLLELGIEVGIVIGGGNIFRGMNANQFGLDRVDADYMGMLATIINGIALKDCLINQKIACNLYSALPIERVTEPYNIDHMKHNISNGNVIIFVGGTGNPFVTTDSGAALRALEINADLLIKATNVDGVYNVDPKNNPEAIKYDSITFVDAIKQNLNIMDISAFDLCHKHNINIQVCNIFTANALKNAALGNTCGTLVHA